MKKEQFSYKKLSDFGCQVLNKGQVPLYMKKFSKKTFTTHQLLTLLLIKTYEIKGFRAFISWLKVSYIPDYCHEAILEKGKITFGCLKNLDVPIHRTQGQTRKLVKRHYNHRKKNWRDLIESINRDFKAVCSHVVQAKKLHTQKAKMFLKLITYNLYRRITRKINFALHWIADLISNFILCFKHKMVMTSWKS